MRVEVATQAGQRNVVAQVLAADVPEGELRLETVPHLLKLIQGNKFLFQCIELAPQGSLGILDAHAGCHTRIYPEHSGILTARDEGINLREQPLFPDKAQHQATRVAIREHIGDYIAGIVIGIEPAAHVKAHI